MIELSMVFYKHIALKHFIRKNTRYISFIEHFVFFDADGIQKRNFVDTRKIKLN